MKKFSRYAGMAALPLALLMPLGAQQNEGMTRQQGEQILQELREIKQLLQQQAPKAAPQEPPAPTHAKLSLEGFQMLGSKTAPMTMVEFTDYQCPFCQHFHVTTFGELKKNYIDTGKVRFYSRDLPLDFHPNAMRAAQAARCAIDQGKYWQIRDVMGANPDKLDLEHLVGFAVGPEDGYDRVPRVRDQREVQERGADGRDGSDEDRREWNADVRGREEHAGGCGWRDRWSGAMPYALFDEKLKALQK